MTSWNEFQRAEPTFADAVRQTFAVRKHATMATIDASGGPRISGTEVDFRADGEVYLGMMPGARRAWDLRADPRVAVHCPTQDPPPDDQSSWAGESKLSAVAVETAAGSHEFRLDLRRVVLTRIAGDGQQLEISWWQPGRPLRVALRS
jgi:hypothetical protein